MIRAHANLKLYIACECEIYNVFHIFLLTSIQTIKIEDD